MQNNIENEINLVDIVISFIKTLIKYKKTIIFIFLIINSFGLIYIIIKKPVYKTEMIISSPVVTSERITFFIEPLGKLAAENNIKELSKLLGIDSSITIYIKDIEAKELRDETKMSKSENYDSEFLRQQNCLVTIKIKSKPHLSDTVQQGIVNYLRNNNFIKRRTEIEMSNLLNLKSRIQNEIKELDTLKRKFTKSNGEFSMMDPSSINNSIAHLYQQELNLDLKMKLDDGGVNIIRDFVKYKNSIEPKINIVFLICFILSVFTSYLTIFIINIREKIKFQS